MTKDEFRPPNLKKIFYKTIRHFFPKFRGWLRSLEDPRQANSCRYSLATMIWVGLLLFLLKRDSRRQINYDFNSERFVRNLSFLVKKDLVRLPHGDTLGNLLADFDYWQLYNLRVQLINQLIRNKCLAKFRLNGYYLIGIDGTGLMSFERRHCDHCLAREVATKRGKKTIYYHPVVDAKLVTDNGFALSVETEFIENQTVGQHRQDCELSATYRLLARLGERFPQLRICLLLDGLYANEGIFDICKKNKWKYIIVFKEGSLPETYVEYESLKKRCVAKRGEYETEEEKQRYQWVEGINYKWQDKYFINVLESIVEKKQSKNNDEITKWLWVTNFDINKSNYAYLANKGGRLRWKVENEGNNTQKNGGYNLEHAYSYNFVAMKNFYLLLQIAHLINQLVEKGSLLTAQDWKYLGSIKNLTRRLFEDLRYNLFDRKTVETDLEKTFQIRFDTS